MRNCLYSLPPQSLLLKVFISVALHLSFSSGALAQIGQHRSEFALGITGGYAMSTVGFMPKVPQNMHGGMTAGVTMRYTSEKYFSTVCAIVGELNYTKMGWTESILTIEDQPVINDISGMAEEYQRDISYIQVPIFARLGWGRERQGLQAFVQAGPQLGFYLNEETKANFDLKYPNEQDRTSLVSSSVKDASNMYFMPVEKKFDYGIALGLGVEFSHTKVGHFIVEGRYYYGLGNVYGSTKRDYFSISNFSTIYVKLSYLIDISRTKNDKVK